MKQPYLHTIETRLQDLPDPLRSFKLLLFVSFGVEVKR